MKIRLFSLALAFLTLSAVVAATHAPAMAQAQDTKPSVNEREWVAAMVSRLEGVKHMPAAVRQSATPGAHTVSISFRVLRSGEIAYARIVRRSGEETVDAAARASLARAFPLPPFPTSMKGPARDFTLPYRFMVPKRVEENESGDGAR